MSVDYSTEAIIAGAKLRTMAPSNQFRFDDTDYLSLINDELMSRLVPLIMSVRESYYLESGDYTIQTVNVDGFGEDNFGIFPFGSPLPVTTMDLLQRSVGLTIKDIWRIDNNGIVLGQVPQLSFPDIRSTENAPGFYFKNSKILFHPLTSFNNVNVRIFTFRQPNKLVPSSQCAKVIFNNTVEEKIQVDAVPSGWVIGTKLDILKGTQGFDSILDSVSIGGIDGTNIYLSETSSEIGKNDIVCPEFCASIAQIPVNAYPLLMQLGAMKILESMKDSEGLKNAYAQYQLLEQSFKGVVSNRAQSNLKSMVGRGLWR